MYDKHHQKNQNSVSLSIEIIMTFKKLQIFKNKKKKTKAQISTFKYGQILTIIYILLLNCFPFLYLVLELFK